MCCTCGGGDTNPYYFSVLPCKDGGEYYTGVHVSIFAGGSITELKLSKVVLVGDFCDEVKITYDTAAWST